MKFPVHKTSSKYFEHFHNIIAERIPRTPGTGLPSEDEDFPEGNVILRDEIKRRGFKIMTTEEKQGREIHDIIPIQGKEESYSNEGSNYFPFHVEVPHYPIQERPDAVILFCLRGTVGGANRGDKFTFAGKCVHQAGY